MPPLRFFPLWLAFWVRNGSVCHIRIQPLDNEESLQYARSGSCPGRRLQAALLFSACVQSLKQRLERVLQTLAERRALWIVAEVCV